MDSILNTIKKMLGIETDYSEFDFQIIVSINSAFMILNQLGVGPSTTFAIRDSTALWSDFLDGITVNVEGVKEYVYLKTRLVFDPPTVGSVIDAYNRQISELEQRLFMQVDPYVEEV